MEMGSDMDYHHCKSVPYSSYPSCEKTTPFCPLHANMNPHARSVFIRVLRLLVTTTTEGFRESEDHSVCHHIIGMSPMNKLENRDRLGHGKQLGEVKPSIHDLHSNSNSTNPLLNLMISECANGVHQVAPLHCEYSPRLHLSIAFSLAES